jgi:hypothetical protein
MQPIYPNVAVEPIEDRDSALALVVEQRPVVRIIAMPLAPKDEVLDFRVGNKVLADHVEEYVVDGEKMYFVRVNNIVSIV